MNVTTRDGYTNEHPEATDYTVNDDHTLTLLGPSTPGAKRAFVATYAEGQWVSCVATPAHRLPCIGGSVCGESAHCPPA